MTLTELNHLPATDLKEALAKCCGATAWVEQVAAAFPVSGKEQLLAEAERVWFACSEKDWREAFTHHPKIGDIDSLKEKFASTSQWAEGEQSAVRHTSEQVLIALAAGNLQYEEKFGYIFIVCATGKSAGEMLALLQARLHNNPSDEIKIAMAEQNKITRLRLEKLLAA
ncbi:MAG TPA: 2-oxo-4-hydroxy-4-carboxy-5-ureidoimidazoline decarboxylase [Chitinophagaceae bacterium]